MNLIDYISYYINEVIKGQDNYVYGLLFSVLTVLSCILFNNLPGTIILSNIVNSKYMVYDDDIGLYMSAFSVAAASNFGALFMAHCTLAGLMW